MFADRLCFFELSSPAIEKSVRSNPSRRTYSPGVSSSPTIRDLPKEPFRYFVFTGSPPRTYLHSCRLLLPVRSTQPCDEQIANRACKTHSSPASAAPAASYKSSYRKCPGGKHLGPRGNSPPAHLSIGS